MCLSSLYECVISYLYGGEMQPVLVTGRTSTGKL